MYTIEKALTLLRGRPAELKAIQKKQNEKKPPPNPYNPKWARSIPQDSLIEAVVHSFKYKGKCKGSALHYAALMSDTQLLQEVLKRVRGASSAVDEKGRTPLHYTAFCNNVAGARLLMDAGLGLTKDENGETAYDIAVAMCYDEYVQFIDSTKTKRTVKRVDSLKVLASKIVSDFYFTSEEGRSSITEVMKLQTAAYGQILSSIPGHHVSRWEAATKLDSRNKGRLAQVIENSQQEHLECIEKEYLCMGSLISVFDRREWFKICDTSDMETGYKSFVKPTTKNVPQVGDYSVVDRETFLKQFEIFTGQDWSEFSYWKDGIVVIGGAVAAALLPVFGDDGKQLKGEALRAYYDEHWTSSDVDVYFYGYDNSESLEGMIVESSEYFTDKNGWISMNVRTPCTITQCFGYPKRHMQMSLAENFETIESIILTTDIDITSVGFDGDTVWASKRALNAFNTRYNLASTQRMRIRQNVTFCKRLLKYSNRGFGIADPCLNYLDIDSLSLKGVQSIKERGEKEEGGIEAVIKGELSKNNPDLPGGAEMMIEIFSGSDIGNKLRSLIEKGSGIEYLPYHKNITLNEIREAMRNALNASLDEADYQIVPDGYLYANIYGTAITMEPSIEGNWYEGIEGLKNIEEGTVYCGDK